MTTATRSSKAGARRALIAAVRRWRAGRLYYRGEFAASTFSAVETAGRFDLKRGGRVEACLWVRDGGEAP